MKHIGWRVEPDECNWLHSPLRFMIDLRGCADQLDGAEGVLRSRKNVRTENAKPDQQSKQAGLRAAAEDKFLPGRSGAGQEREEIPTIGGVSHDCCGSPWRRNPSEPESFCTCESKRFGTSGWTAVSRRNAARRRPSWVPDREILTACQSSTSHGRAELLRKLTGSTLEIFTSRRAVWRVRSSATNHAVQPPAA